ncbi:MAG: HAD family phosphatase [Bacteroidales bacterium]|nr:HAD family phosphatase [Bacteroidales bacterium]
MIKNIIFDFGAVLVDWNPHHLYDSYFGDATKAEWFLTEICPYEWNAQCDAGRPIKDITAERVALFPEWEKEIRMYFDHWVDMMGDPIPGMEELVRDYKQRGYGVWGLTNWSAETLPLVRDDYPVFKLLDGYVVSGQEKVVKPDARLYRILLERFGLKAEECVFIDDNPANTAGAEAVGIRGIVFHDAEQLRKDLTAVLGDSRSSRE